MDNLAEDALALWWHGDLRLPEAELIDWLRRQRLLPLMGWRAEQQDWALPAGMEAAIKQARYRHAVQHTIVEAQLQQIGELLVALGASAILVKGLAAAASYPQSWMRPTGDIDLLIPHEQLHAVYEALRRHGYTPTEESRQHSKHHLPMLVPEKTGTPVEIHASLELPRYRSMRTAEWFASAEPSPTHPGLLALTPVSHLYYLAYHATLHHELRIMLTSLTDIVFITQGWSAEAWQDLLAGARKKGRERVVGLALALAEWLWGGSWFDGQRDTFPSPPENLLSSAKETVLGGHPEKLPNIWRERSLRGIIAYGRRAFAGEAELLADLNAAQHLWFYVARPLDLLQRHGPMLWQLATSPAARRSYRARDSIEAWLLDK